MSPYPHSSPGSGGGGGYGGGPPPGGPGTPIMPSPGAGTDGNPGDPIYMMKNVPNSTISGVSLCNIFCQNSISVFFLPR